MQTAVSGFLIGFSLILAIGAQNAFVLRQGLRREHVFAVCLTASLSDAILILVGVSSFEMVSRLLPWITPALLYAGTAFLVWYGWLNFRAALQGGAGMQTSDIKAKSLKKTVLTCLALSWLNPHVYLDTVVFLGLASLNYDDQIAFASGAVLSSFTFFFMLGYGARLLEPVFVKPSAWRVLDTIVALTMWAIAATLLLN